MQRKVSSMGTKKMTGERVMLDRNGDVRSAAAWSEATQLPVQVIIWRVKQQGWSVEKALSTPYYPGRGGKKMYEYHDRKMSLAEWSRELQKPYSLLFNRMDRGWTFEEAVETPVNESPPRLTNAKNPVCAVQEEEAQVKKAQEKKEESCKGCIHYRPIVDGSVDGIRCCHYILDTGRVRPCPGGEECTVKETGEMVKKRPKPLSLKGRHKYHDWFEDEGRIASW